ncbi:ATP-binding cassette domain-containing protein [Streptomyces sp. LZ34]
MAESGPGKRGGRVGGRGARPGPYAEGIRFLRERRRVLLRLAAWSALESGQTFLGGYALARALDDGFLAGERGVGLAWLGLAALAVAFGAYGTGRVYRAMAALVEPLRDALVRRVVTHAVGGAGGVGAGGGGSTAVSRLTHQVEIARDTFAGLVMVSRSFVFVAAGALVGLFSLAPVLLLVVLPPLVLGLALFLATLRPMARRQEAFLEADENIAETLGAVASGLRDIAAAGAEERVGADAGERIDAEYRAARALARWGVVRAVALGVGGRLPVVLLLVAAPWLLGRGVTTGALVGALAYLQQSLLPALQSLMQALGTGGSRLAVVVRRLAGTAPDGDEPGPAPAAARTADGPEAPGAETGHAPEGRAAAVAATKPSAAACVAGESVASASAVGELPTAACAATAPGAAESSEALRAAGEAATAVATKPSAAACAAGESLASAPVVGEPPTAACAATAPGAAEPSAAPRAATVAATTGPAVAAPRAAGEPVASAPVVGELPTAACAATAPGAAEPPATARAAADPAAAVPEEAVASRPAFAAVELRSVTFAYGDRAAPVVEGLDLDVPAGGHLAVVGPSGIGKSTLAGLIAGLLEPRSGEVRVCGEPVRGPGAVRPAALRVLIPQEAYVFSGTLADNLRYLCPEPDTAPKARTDAELAAVAEAMGLGALLSRIGGPYADVDPAALSAGERQLIALARAYLSPAPVVLLDEATCHLDPAAEARAERAFARRPGTTLIVIAHRVSSARRAERVLVMDGRHAVCGRHGELLESSALYRDLAGSWDSRESREGRESGSGGRSGAGASDPALAPRDADGVHAVARPGLPGDRGHVVAYGPVGQVQAVGDLGDRGALGGQ